MSDAPKPQPAASPCAMEGTSAPGSSDELAALRALIAQLEQHNRYLQEEIKSVHNFEEIIGQSSPMRAVLEKVRLVAGTETPVLILGETGTGKELIARAIHFNSKRRDQPLIKVNCAAFPPDQLDSELFGHETGAGSRRVSRFELADGGTIFLDEIGEIPGEVQAKLMHVLQERDFERGGGSSSVKVNVRVLSATNRELRRAVREDKTFREDLFNRLNVFPIHVPPLRDRRDDIPLLAQFLVNKFANQIGKRIESITPEMLDQLKAYPWPGNVRELENVVERAVILTTRPQLEIGPEILGVVPPPLPGTPGEQLDMRTVERNHIATILEKTRWVIDGPHGAAKVLGMHPNTLRSRLKKLGLQRPSQES